MIRTACGKALRLLPLRLRYRSRDSLEKESSIQPSLRELYDSASLIAITLQHRPGSALGTYDLRLGAKRSTPMMCRCV